MKIRLTVAASVIALSVFSVDAANAATYVVDAIDSTPVTTSLNLTAGESFSVTAVDTVANPTAIWSMGDLPRWSDANGLVGDVFATGSDASGEPFGTQIGQDYGTLMAYGLTLPYGSLVGNIGGIYEFLGADFNGKAWNTGTLQLLTFDTPYSDNSGSITFDVSAVPEPATWAMMLLGFGAIGWTLRSRRDAAAVAV